MSDFANNDVVVRLPASPEALKRLSERTDTELDGYFLKALRACCGKGNTETARALIDIAKGRNIFRGNASALMEHAILYADGELVDAILAEKRADPSVKLDLDQFLLQAYLDGDVTDQGIIHIVGSLVDAGADPTVKLPGAGSSVLTMARQISGEGAARPVINWRERRRLHRLAAAWAD